MAFNFPFNIQLNNNSPLDTRLVVANATERLSMAFPYEGLLCFQKDTKELYITYKDSQDVFRWYRVDTGTATNLYLRGYYLNGKFYTDITYQVELDKDPTKIYIDNNEFNFYAYQDNQYIPFTPLATDLVPGIMRLYSSSGQNTDGTMTQKAITDGVNQIALNLESGENETLVLDLPWD